MEKLPGPTPGEGRIFDLADQSEGNQAVTDKTLTDN